MVASEIAAAATLAEELEVPRILLFFLPIYVKERKEIIKF
jgi:hypothetical protein